MSIPLTSSTGIHFREEETQTTHQTAFQCRIFPSPIEHALLRQCCQPFFPSLPARAAPPRDMRKPRRLPGPSKKPHAVALLSHGHLAGRLAWRDIHGLQTKPSTPSGGAHCHVSPGLARVFPKHRAFHQLDREDFGLPG